MTDTREPPSDVDYARATARMGMYLFLATEIMLFGGLFAALMVARLLHGDETALASQRFNLWLGAANTVILLTSSLAVACAVEAAKACRRRWAAGGLAAAVGLGLVFLAIKAVEYYEEYAQGLIPGLGDRAPDLQPAEALYINLYLVATGLHAVHMLAGLAMLSGLALGLAFGRVRLPRQFATVEITGLYWHLVDIVWVFLFPALYLAR